MQNRQLDGMFHRALGRETSWAPPGLAGDYAVVDCARNARIYPAMKESRVKSVCLYDGALSPALARVAPYLVRLERGSRFASTFYDAGWNDAWGLVIRGRVEVGALRRHFRTLAYVRRADGPRLLFRYYDTRVMRVFLPTCDTTQLRQVFGPIDAFVLDAADGGVPQVMTRGEDGSLCIQDHPS